MTSSPCGVLAAIRRGSVGVGQVPGGVDERDVRERLRKVADEALLHDVVLLRQQSQIVSQRQEPAKQLVRLARASLQRVVVRQPERAGEKRPLACRQTVYI